MRVFIALPVPEAVVARVRPAVAPLRERWPELRWTNPAGWHLTLAFLGEVETEVVTALEAQVRTAVAEHPSVLARLPGHAEAAPGRRGIVWIPVEGEGLAPLAETVRDACDAAGAEPDRRHAFSGHLTLCRVPRRSVRNAAGLARTVAAAYDGPAVQWQAPEVVVTQSVQSADGAQYVALERIPLRPAD